MSIATTTQSTNRTTPNASTPNPCLKTRMRTAVSHFCVDEDGTTAVEYAVMLALITAVCFVTVQVMVNAAEESFKTSGDAIAAAG